ncbi:EamA family transporter RarD [Saccharothrix algeriensis]|uniref:Chloramphenicol-sensitive protein RarD n=1 Tax=Saccharothrix algeriensis TaxID=173560 RepID=A0A8T8HRY9_9PSEU|nr:EamA family transporter RarD [Saccharothrix algeriensis]MBM7812638.1 chloramphenicol-sensitive protein RarD [Saccharothrix algeriensis]QTR01343.1 EamA family transporter RarD [Saccharothrix algeriensis]
MPPLTNSTATTGETNHTNRGVAFGVGAYFLWGVVPAYWPLLAPAGAVEILAHRIAWSLLVMLLITAVLGRWAGLRTLSRRGWLMVAAASVLIAVNWGVYIHAVNTGHVVEGALGYFMNPLVSVLLGVLVLRERLRRAQCAAIAVALAAVVVLAVDYGRLPWMSLVLACSFGLYGLLKKTVPLDATGSLTAEGVVLAPIAVGYLVWLGPAGTFHDHGVGHALLMVSTGLVTAVPLVLFGAGARRVPLVTMGMLQYLAPVLQFAWGVFVMHEPMPPSRWFGFALVWVALAVFTADALRSRRRQRLLAPVE